MSNRAANNVGMTRIKESAETEIKVIDLWLQHNMNECSEFGEKVSHIIQTQICMCVSKNTRAHLAN